MNRPLYLAYSAKTPLTTAFAIFYGDDRCGYLMRQRFRLIQFVTKNSAIGMNFGEIVQSLYAW